MIVPIKNSILFRQYFLSLLALFFSANLWAVQDSIKVNELDSIKLDTTTIHIKSFIDLKEKYSDSDFDYKESTAETPGWWLRFKRWLDKLFDVQRDGQSSNAVDIGLKIFFGLLLITAIYFIVKAFINKEGVNIFGKTGSKNLVSVSDLEAQTLDINFPKLISKAEKESEYRIAVRYYYLWLIKSLTKADLITFDVEKTNSDYLDELQSHNLFKQFSYTSYLYNYIWYGEFDVDSVQYNKAKLTFVQLLKSINK